jgi:hypothetical protein
MNIERELRRHLILAAIANFFVAPVMFLLGMFFLIFYHIKLTNSLSTGML